MGMTALFTVILFRINQNGLAIYSEKVLKDLSVVSHLIILHFEATR